MKSYTDIEQSKVLSKILPIESADMEYILEHWIDEKTYWHKEGYCETPVVKVEDDCPLQPITHPCWSLTALLNVIPNNENISINLSKGGFRISTLKYTDDWFVDYEDESDGLNNCVTSADNPVDACYEMILKLHELILL